MGSYPTSTGPAVLSLSATVAVSSAQVTWSLDQPCTGYLEWGTTTAYGHETAHETSFNYSTHIQDITGLTPGTTYHFRTHNANAAGWETVSADETFTTSPTYGIRPAPASLAALAYPSTVTWQPKTAGTTYHLTAGMTEAQQNAVLATVANGTITAPSLVVWAPGTYSRVSGVPVAAGAHDIIHWGYGAVLNITGDGSSVDHSGFRLSSYNQTSVQTQRIKVLGFEVKGQNTYAGTFQAFNAPGANGEGAMGIAVFSWVTDVEIADCYIHNQWSDNLYVGADPNTKADSFDVHHNRLAMSGRQSITWDQGNDAYIHHNLIEDAAGSFLDAEDARSTTCRLNRFHFTDNYINRWMWYYPGSNFDSIGASVTYQSGQVSPMDGWYFERNVLVGGPQGNGSLAHIGPHGDWQAVGCGYPGTSTVAKSNVFIRGNDFSALPAGFRNIGLTGIRVEYATGGDVSGNTGTSGLLISITNSSGVTQGNNT